MTLRKSQCPQGHSYENGNTYWYNGSRRCRKCTSIRTGRSRRLKTLKKKLIHDLGEELGNKTFLEVKGKYFGDKHK